MADGYKPFAEGSKRLLDDYKPFTEGRLQMVDDQQQRNKEPPPKVDDDLSFADGHLSLAEDSKSFADDQKKWFDDHKKSDEALLFIKKREKKPLFSSAQKFFEKNGMETKTCNTGR